MATSLPLLPSPLLLTHLPVTPFSRSLLPSLLSFPSLPSMLLTRSYTSLCGQLPLLSPVVKLHTTDAASRRTVPRRAMASMSDQRSNGGMPRSVPVRVAHELLQAGHRYLDVRTPEEFTGGHASGAVNVPYMYKIGNGMSKNTKFLEEVSTHFGKDDEIIVGCLSGKRSLMAATDLLSAGYTGITDIAGGYSAWIQNGLPTAT